MFIDDVLTLEIIQTCTEWDANTIQLEGTALVPRYTTFHSTTTISQHNTHLHSTNSNLELPEIESTVPTSSVQGRENDDLKAAYRHGDTGEWPQGNNLTRSRAYGSPNCKRFFVLLVKDDKRDPRQWTFAFRQVPRWFRTFAVLSALSRAHRPATLRDHSPLQDSSRGCEWVRTIPLPPLCACVGMSWGDLYFYLIN